MRLSPSRRAVVTAVAALATAAVTASATVAGAATHGARQPRWAAASVATVHPGVSVTMAGVQCRVGFVLTDGRNAYLAIPGSCSGVSDGQAADGCTEAQVPVGTTATVEGARYPAHLVYSSFTDMASRGVRNQDMCTMNALSLLKLDRRDISRTNPSVPIVGGPTGTDSSPPAPGAALTLYLAAPAQATAVQNGNNGWSHTVVPETAVMAIDVGAPVVDGQGRALGMVSTVEPVPAGPAMVGDLGHEIAYLHHLRAFRNVRLALGGRFVG